MIKYLKTDPWCIIEDEFNPEHHQSSESIFSLGNGSFGQRANFEESYSGKSLQGTYVAGIYYPDKTKVGWWKNGYPESFAKVLNACNFTGINILIDNEVLDLAKCKILSFRRVLNMKEGTLNRSFKAELGSGKQVEVLAVRFLSMVNQEVGAIRYSITALTADVEVKFTPYLDGNVRNEDANWDDAFWTSISQEVNASEGFVLLRTKKTEFDVATGMHTKAFIDSKQELKSKNSNSKEAYVAVNYKQQIIKGKTLDIYKYIAVLSSLNHSKEDLLAQTKKISRSAAETGFENLLLEHKQRWAEIWNHSDILIDGNDEDQQGIRFNIFHLNQTYTGTDDRLNIGPKGFTGEKYGGASYWDTEAYCLPFFLATAKPEVSRNLLKYRYKHLKKAIENAEKLGFVKGAALYPMVTMNGDECHNEWEITFEEIHRNGAIAFAIYNYLRHTNDKSYLIEAGLEVLVAISRFWSQRITFSIEKDKYVMLGVTGPNEYENNVNNNWYTNTIAIWTLKYTLEVIDWVRLNNSKEYDRIVAKISFDKEETVRWEDIIVNMYLPILEEEGIFLQQDGYMDKEQLTVEKLHLNERPINQHWSWDRILRSCFIKQADVLQGIYLFEENYSLDEISRNFDFYEPRTVHESSLSPCIHVVLAARLNKMQLAYSLYLRTARLDIDDYNREVHEGLHITSMAGTYMAIVEGFAGKRILEGKLVFNPQIPGNWERYSFKMYWQNSLLKFVIESKRVSVENESGKEACLCLYNKEYKIGANCKIDVAVN